MSFCLLALYGRCRFQDAARVNKEPFLEAEGDGPPTFETDADPRHWKTGAHAARRGARTPVAGPAVGLKEPCWVEHYLEPVQDWRRARMAC